MLTMVSGKMTDIKTDDVKKELTEKQQEFIDRFADEFGLNVKRTCEAVGIARQTYYRWLECDNSDTFRVAVEDATEGMKDDVEQAMYSKMIADENVPLMIHFSKTKMRERGYGEHQTVKHEGNGVITHIESEYVEP